MKPRTLIAFNTASQLVGKIISAAATFLVTILIARSFGVNGFGDFTKITSYVALFYLLADFGLNAVYLQKDDTWWGPLVWLRLLGSIVLIFFAISLLAFLPQGVTQGYTGIVRLGIILFSPAILVAAMITTTNAVFQKKLRYDKATVALTVGSIISVLFVWFITKITTPQFGSVFSALGILAGTAATATTALLLAGRIPVSLDVKKMKALFFLSFPLGLTLLFNQVYFRVDSFILTLTRSTSDVGIYGLAYKIFEVILVIPTFFMNALYPLMLRTENVALIIKKSFFVLLVTSLLSLIILWLFAPLVIFIRPEFTQSIAPLRVLSLGFPFFFLSALTMWALIAKKKQMTIAIIYFLSMVVTTGLDIFFIPKFGYMAAAWITIASEGFVLLLSGLVLIQALSLNKENEKIY